MDNPITSISLLLFELKNPYARRTDLIDFNRKKLDEIIKAVCAYYTKNPLGKLEISAEDKAVIKQQIKEKSQHLRSINAALNNEDFIRIIITECSLCDCIKSPVVHNQIRTYAKELSKLVDKCTKELTQNIAADELRKIIGDNGI